MCQLLLLTVMGLTITTQLESVSARSTRCFTLRSFDTTLDCDGVLIVKRAVFGGSPNLCHYDANDGTDECLADVSEYIMTHCRRENRCTINLRDPELHNQMPSSCTDRYWSMKVDYFCVKVPESADCRLTVPSIQSTISNPSQDLTTWVDSNPRACGSELRPWILEAPEGQQLLLSLTSLESESANSTEPAMKTECSIAAVVSEQMTTSISSYICDVHSTEPRPVYASHTNVIQVIMNKNSQEYTGSILKFAAFGCANPDVNNDAVWVRRYDRMLIVGCRFHNRMWRLFCTDSMTWDSSTSFDCPTEITSDSWSAI